jgi:hypothetical protein
MKAEAWLLKNSDSLPDMKRSTELQNQGLDSLDEEASPLPSRLFYHLLLLFLAYNIERK